MRHTMRLLCFFVALSFYARAEVIDRIVAVVDGRIITTSDLRQERTTRALLGDKPIDDDLTLTKLLADNHLIERQIVDYPNIEVTEAEIDAEVAKFDRRDELVSKTLRNELRRRIRIQKFFDMRFRELIRPTDDEVRKYYEEVFVPEARKRGLQSIPPLDNPEMTTAIRQNVIQEKLDKDVQAWLEVLRTRSNIEIFK
jgi:parvulin-like peptidyl-prolyl isomerase